jgi:hypothetical protein
MNNFELATPTQPPAGNRAYTNSPTSHWSIGDPLFSQFRPKNSQGDLRFIFVVTLLWLPAFGWLPEHSITFKVMGVSCIIVILLTLFVWISGLQTKSSRAWLYMAVYTTPFLLTCLIYFVRFIELLFHTFSLPEVHVIFWGQVVLFISFQRLYVAFNAQRTKLKTLRQRGFLRKYGIFDEQEALWKITSSYPGVDGTTPQEEAIKAQQQWGCLAALPISGLAFFLIRSAEGSVAWILLFIFIFVYFSFSFIAVRTLAALLQVGQWEGELGKPILTRVEKV